MNEEFLQIERCQDTDCHSQVYSEGWRAVYLNDTPKFHLENMGGMQRHNTSDEVFVLLKRSYTLYTGNGGDERSGTVRVVELEPGVVYNI